MLDDQPHKIDSKAAWVARDIPDNTWFSYQFTSNDIKAFKNFVLRAKSLKYFEITKQDIYPSNIFNKISTAFQQEIYYGHGVKLLTGLNPESFDIEELKKIHWGIGLHLGRPKRQYSKWILNIQDSGYQLHKPGGRNHNTSEKLWFHNDSCALTGLMCVVPAKYGGETQVVSSAAIYNHMQRTHPDLCKALLRPYYRKHRHISGKFGSNEVEYFPVFNFNDQGFFCDMSRPVFDLSESHPSVPRLSSTQSKALDMLETYAEHPDFCHTFSLAPGDILYLNNNVTLHARKPFKDSGYGGKKRLLLRVHLNRFQSHP